MSKNDFNWDNYFSNAAFTQIRSNSPDLSGRRLPTTYSPDKKRIYLSSQDYDVEVDDIELLMSAFTDIKASYRSELQRQSKDYLRLWLARIDFIEVCSLISNLVESPEEFGDPDELLDQS